MSLTRQCPRSSGAWLRWLARWTGSARPRPIATLPLAGKADARALMGVEWWLREAQGDLEQCRDMPGRLMRETRGDLVEALKKHLEKALVTAERDLGRGAGGARRRAAHRRRRRDPTRGRRPRHPLFCLSCPPRTAALLHR